MGATLITLPVSSCDELSKLGMVVVGASVVVVVSVVLVVVLVVVVVVGRKVVVVVVVVVSCAKHLHPPSNIIRHNGMGMH